MQAEIAVALIAASAGIITAFGALLSKLASLLHEVNAVKVSTKQLSLKFDHETAPNSGSSLKDALNRIEQGQEVMLKDISRLADVDNRIQDTQLRENRRLWSSIEALKQRNYNGKSNDN